MGEGVRRQVYNILLKNIDKHYQEKTCLFHTALTNTQQLSELRWKIKDRSLSP